MWENRNTPGVILLPMWFGFENFNRIIKRAKHTHLLVVCLLDLRCSLNTSALIPQGKNRLYTLSSVRGDIENVIKVCFDRHLTARWLEKRFKASQSHLTVGQAHTDL